LSATPNGKNHRDATNSPLRRHLRHPHSEAMRLRRGGYRLGHTTRFFTIVHQQTPPAVK
jgi:hypothetical protein